MRVRWRRRALDDLIRIKAWLAAIEGAKPARAIKRIRAAAARLQRFPHLGRPSVVEGNYELSVPSAPYVVVYQISEAEVGIIAVFHAAEKRE